MPKVPEAPCPRCQTLSRRLDLLSLRFVSVDYYRCMSCNHVWKAPKTSLERRIQ